MRKGRSLFSVKIVSTKGDAERVKADGVVRRLTMELRDKAAQVGGLVALWVGGPEGHCGRTLVLACEVNCYKLLQVACCWIIPPALCCLLARLQLLKDARAGSG